MLKNTVFIISLCACLSACGYESKGNDLMGQPKKVVSNTPLICPNYRSVDISLGVMRNGVGSMSTEDLWMAVDRKVDIEGLKMAVATGAIIKAHYDVRRITFCIPDHVLTSYEIITN